MIDVNKVAGLTVGLPKPFEASPTMRSFVPPAPATRRGQMEIVAATLAAGLIAADHGRASTVEAAVELMREVLAVAWPEAS